jgi:hypothetical protein
MRAPDCLKMVEAAMELRAHNQVGWDKFVAATGEYAAQVLAMTMGADAAVILRAQGMAIQAAEIAKILRDAPRMYEEAQQQKMKAQNHASRKHPTADGNSWPPF